MDFGPSTQYEEFGTGNPKTLVIGGLSFAPGDIEEFAEHHEGRLDVQYQPHLDGSLDIASNANQTDRDAADYYLDYLDENQVDRIMAISLGCRHALMAAQKADIPELVLVAPPLSCPDLKHLRRSTELVIDIPKDNKNKGSLHGMLYSITQPMRNEVYLAMLSRHSDRAKGYEASHSRRLMMQNAETLNEDMVVERTRNYLASFNGKITVIYGDQDPFFDQKTFDRLLKVKPGIEVAPALEGVGHFPHIEAPEKLAELINNLNMKV